MLHSTNNENPPPRFLYKIHGSRSWKYSNIQSINEVNLLIIDKAILKNLTIKGIVDFATVISEGRILT